MSELLALGASHKTASLALRERIALTDGAAEALLGELMAAPAIQEGVALSTCNRTELYLVVRDPVEGETAVLATLARRAGMRPTELVEGIYSLRNCDAARHLYRVTSGLESMVVGESEVQGQVKRAYELALAARTTGPMTNKLFRAALATGKRVRTETAVSVGHASVASMAVDTARAALGDLAERHVLIVGAGETAELTAQALHAQGVTTMFVANRRRERAIALAQRFGGASGSFDALPGELERADIVIASTASPHHLIGADELAEVMSARRRRPLLLLDLAVPRDVDPDCATLPGVTLLDVDGLQKQVKRHLTVRRAEARRAEGIVEEEIQTFAGWLGALDVTPVLGALRARADAVVDGLLAENESRWEALGEQDRRRVEMLARAAVNRLLHEPTMRIKALDADQRHARLQLLRELFGLEDAGEDARREGEAAAAAGSGRAGVAGGGSNGPARPRRAGGSNGAAAAGSRAGAEAVRTADVRQLRAR